MQGNYKVYNLCSERLYDASLFEGKVLLIYKHLLGAEVEYFQFFKFNFWHETLEFLVLSTLYSAYYTSIYNLYEEK